MKRYYLPILGSGAVALGPLVEAVLEKTDCEPVIVTSDMEKYRDENGKKVFVNDIEKYKLMPVTKERLDSGKKSSPNELLCVGRDDENLEYIIRNSKCLISVCREGLFTYTSIIEGVVTNSKSYSVYSLDNNPIYAEIAQKKCTNPNIRYYKGVIHAVAFSRKITPKGVYVSCQKDSATIILPPEATAEEFGLQNEIGNPFIWKPQIKIANSKEEFELSVFEKIMLVNAQHTYQATLCISKGLEAGENICDIENKKWRHYWKLNEMYYNSARIYLILYTALLYQAKATSNSEDCMDNIREYDKMMEVLYDFLEIIYYSEEKISRAISISKPNEKVAKFEMHIKMLENSLKVAKEPEVQKVVIDFLESIGRRVTTEEIENAILFCAKVIKDAYKYYGD